MYVRGSLPPYSLSACCYLFPSSLTLSSLSHCHCFSLSPPPPPLSLFRSRSSQPTSASTRSSAQGDILSIHSACSGCSIRVQGVVCRVRVLDSGDSFCAQCIILSVHKVCSVQQNEVNPDIATSQKRGPEEKRRAETKILFNCLRKAKNNFSAGSARNRYGGVK